MEKYLRLLSTKTTNYESIGGGSYGALTAQDVCIAISYAKLTPLQDYLIRLKCLGANTSANVIKMSNALLELYRSRFEDLRINSDHHYAIVHVALTEFCFVAADYKPSVRNRGVLAGVNHLVIHRYLNDHITNVRKDLDMQLELGFEKINFQLTKTN